MAEKKTSDGSLLLEVGDDGVARITLNRPDQLNALDCEVAEQLVRAFCDLAVRTNVRCAVLLARGSRAFCVGADLKERARLGYDGVRRQHSLLRLGLTIRQSLEIPTIAAVHGYALGGGAELALASDIVIAATGTELGFPEIELGFMPGLGGTQLLPRLVGSKCAFELLASGERLSAERALELGLVSEVVSGDALHNHALDRARQLAGRAPLALRALKRAITVGGEMDMNSGLGYELALHQRLMASEDREEGIRAFVEKRPPRWQGR